MRQGATDCIALCSQRRIQRHYGAAAGLQVLPGKRHEGQTALHYATSYDHPQVVKQLLAVMPALAHVVDALGRHPLHYACSGPVAEELFVPGSLLTAVDNMGRTALHGAAKISTSTSWRAAGLRNRLWSTPRIATETLRCIAPRSTVAALPSSCCLHRPS